MTADPLRPPETDDEPWVVPEPDHDPDDRYWYAFLCVVVLGFVVLALVRAR